jgi:hypothetical protein
VFVTVTALVCGTLAGAGAAQAQDLIVLGPDSATISGAVSYDHLYIGDGATLRLAGDTSISAADVYLSGNATLRTCFVAPSSDNGCTVGRSLSIQSSGQINIGTGINLSAGSGTPRPGGSLFLSGASVTVSGGIDTSGSMAGGSGAVQILSPGAIALGAPYYQASINAPGANVTVHGASVALTGDVDTAGSDANIISGAPVDLASSTGALRIAGNINTSGRDSSGGTGANVSLHGTDVHVGRIDAGAGSSSTGAAGLAGSVSIAGSASVTVTDYIDTRGASGAANYGATGGGSVNITSAGPVLAGTIYASSANANGAPPTGAGAISVSGTNVALGQLFTNGGNRAGGSGYGAPGGTVSVSATSALSVDEVETFGGNSTGDGYPGAPGGAIALAGDGIFTSELRSTAGSATGNSPGGSAAPITVNGRSAVTILGGVFANGQGASGNAGNAGGAGANVSLHATAGPLALSGTIHTGGGNGSNAPSGTKAGPGGGGGALDLVGTPIDPIAGISTDGGDGGFSNDTDHRGSGGNGGSVHAWSETNIFGTLRSISTGGGSGVAPGIDGAELQDSGPTALSIDANGLLSFTSQSPNAQGFNVIQTLGTAATTVLTTRATSKLAVPAVAICTPVTYQVQAFQSAVGWTSPLTAPVAFLRQPSATQKCTDAPALVHSGTVKVKLSSLAKNKGALSFTVQTNGIGTVDATATSKGIKAPVAVATIPLAKTGAFKVTLTIDKKTKLQYKLVKQKSKSKSKSKKKKKAKSELVAHVAVKLVATAPSGKAATSITVPVEVQK